MYLDRKCYLIKTSKPVTKVTGFDSFGNMVYQRIFETPVSEFWYNGNGHVKFESENGAKFKDTISEKLYKPELILPEPYMKGTKGYINKIVYVKGWNGSPAANDIKKGILYLNDRFRTFPKFQQDFIIDHEHGHHFYDTEEECDLFALSRCIERGGNISPCLLTIQKTLTRTPRNMERIEEFKKNLSKLT